MCSGPQEAVKHVVIVDVVSRDRPCVVDALGEGALAGACARAGSVERRDAAVGSAHEAVSHIARVNVGSINRSRVVASGSRL
jgi:hypothetical protein